MEIALSIALIAGIFLFIIGFLIVVWGGFKHHFITGIIALIPVLNFIILPSVWYRVYIGFYLSIIGALITLGAWYGGGEQYIANQTQKFGISLPFSSSTAVVEEHSFTNTELKQANSEDSQAQNAQAKIETAKIETAEPEVEQEAFVPSGDLVSLPQKALYELVFEAVSMTDIESLKGEYIRIVQKDGSVSEGKVVQSNSNSLFIEHNENSENTTLEIKADTISELEKLVKRDI